MMYDITIEFDVEKKNTPDLNFSNNLRNTIKRHCKIIPSRICRTSQAYI